MKAQSLLNRKAALAFASAILILLMVGAVSYRGMVVSNESDLWVRHTHEVLESLKDLVLATERVKASAGGFVMTGGESYLDAYRSSRIEAELDRASLRKLTADNPKQQRWIPELERLAAQQIDISEKTIALRQTKGIEAALEVVRSGQGKGITDKVQGIVREMQDEELRLLRLRNTDATRRLGQNKAVLIFGTFLGLLIVAAAGWSVQRDSSRRGHAEDALRESEESYRMLLDGVQNYAIFMLDPLGRVVSWNAGAERTKGYTAGEIIGHNFSRFFPAEDIQQGKPEQVLRLTAVSGRHEEQGMRVRKNGSRFLATVSLTALRDPAGNLRGFSEISRDLTESKESGAKYRGLLEAAPDAMVVVNQSGEIVLLNVQAEKQFGYRRDELLGQKVTNIIPEGFAERLIADGTRTAAEALAQHIGTGIELVGRRKDGSDFPIEIMLSPLESTEGILVTAAVRDISVRKAAEEHLAQMEGRYRGLLEAAPDAMVVVNQGGEIVLLNVQAENQFGYRRDELLGQKVKNIIPEGFAERLIADGTRSPAEALAQQIGTGIELVGRRKDGSDFPIEIMLSPLQSAEGILVTAAIRDITVRKAAEKHLVQMTRDLSLKHQLLESVVEGTTDPIYVRDLEHRFTLANSACSRLFGRSADEVLGRSMRELLPNDTYYAVAQSDQEVVCAGATRTIEEIAEIDGISRIFLTTKGPYRDADQKIIGTIGVARDITERKESEEHLVKTVGELKRSNDELQQFAYVASHDLQEPLRMVASYTQLLAKRYQGRLDSDADEFIAYAVDGCNRMQGLIKDLLAYSRAGTNGKALRKISGENALKDALTNLRGAIEESSAVVSHDSLPAISTDDVQLAQVFQNLVGNAIKYRRAEVPRVHVSATRNGGNEWIFSVRDNGLGIDPQYFERIFVLFQRLHGREEFAGTGIGLAICKKIVERLGGRIWVESQLEKGSTFYFALPGGDGK
jgi:PAS domain S-box-containing protein